MNNILVLSCGTRNKIIEYFKETLGERGIVIAADSNLNAPALYIADAHYIVPKITNSIYIPSIKKICIENNVSGIISLIDPELSILSTHIDEFKNIGVTFVGSNPFLCNLSLNKWEMHLKFKEKGYLTAKTYNRIDSFKEDLAKKNVSFPVILKPCSGSASENIFKVSDIEEMNFYWQRVKNYIIQEFINGKEIGADCYIDMISGNLVSVFTKYKLLMKSGETDKAISFKNFDLFKLIEKLLFDLKFIGPIDIDIFEVEGSYYFSEINPRFGGGYPHAYESGVNHIEMIINNLNNIENKRNIGNYRNNIVMMKYSDLVVRYI